MDNQILQSNLQNLKNLKNLQNIPNQSLNLQLDNNQRLYLKIICIIILIIFIICIIKNIYYICLFLLLIIILLFYLRQSKNINYYKTMTYLNNMYNKLRFNKK